MLQTPELVELESKNFLLNQRILHLHSRINVLVQENKALSNTINQTPTLDNAFAPLSGENAEKPTEEIIARMSQVHLKDIKISELYVEIDRLKKAD